MECVRYEWKKFIAFRFFWLLCVVAFLFNLWNLSEQAKMSWPPAEAVKELYADLKRQPEEERERLIDAEWQQPEGSTGKEKYSTEIKIFANNRIGMFVDISKVFTERQIDITSMNVRTSKQGKATIMMAFDIHGIEELNKLTDKLRQIEGVLDIERTAG